MWSIPEQLSETWQELGRPIGGFKGCFRGAVVTRLLTLRGLLNGESESFGAIFRGARATMGVAFGVSIRSRETEKSPGGTRFPPNSLHVIGYEKSRAT